MYQPTVGLEIHAELKTRTKMFCGCKNDPDEKTPNLNVCPVCMAHPGSLPVINKEAVRSVMRIGSALRGELADYSEFDRKSYFYPDIPKGYQISQYGHPLVRGGSLKGVSITRIHLEEDTARSQHSGDKSLVDFNRAGVPLMELVTEPQIRSAAEAGAFARELQLLLRYVGAGEANMEKGEMRVEANISMGENGKIGTKVEIKNLNSFRSVERAILYEIERQNGLLEHGEKVEQETRGWDDTTQKTFSQRKKESSQDYRYFPDPDLPYLRISEIPEFRNIDLPEMPWERHGRYLALGLKKEDADMFVAQQEAGWLFDTATKHLAKDDPRIMLIANYVANDLAGKWRNIEPTALAVLIEFVYEKKISSRGAKDALAEAISGGGLSKVAEKYLQQSDEGELANIAKKTVAAYPKVAGDYKAGKETALQFLVGQGMKESGGSANPQALREAIQKILG